MTWLKSNWRWGALNLSAVIAFITMLTEGSADWYRTDTFDPGLESGKWAIRFLLTCLTMTPLNTYFGWSSPIKLRKSAGLWTFGFASLHILLYIREAKLDWLRLTMPSFLALGLIGMCILTALAVTSNHWSMQRMGRYWKRLHRLVYVAGIAVVTHSMFAMTMSKKLLFRDPQAEHELKVYVIALCALLVVRIPLVRRLLKQIPFMLTRRLKLVQPASMPDEEVKLSPQVQGREAGVSVKPTFIIPNEVPNPSEQDSFVEPFGGINTIPQPYMGSPSEEETEVQEGVAA